MKDVLRLKLVGLAAAFLLLASGAITSPLPNGEFAAKVDRLMHWIADNSDLEVPDRQPAFLLLPTETINYVAMGSRYGGSNLIVASFSPTDVGIVFLPSEGFDDDVLLHELVHFMQFANGLEVGCAADLERDAYRLQQLFTSETGIGAPLAPVSRILATICPPPWRVR
jgi:hypothetical protein